MLVHLPREEGYGSASSQFLTACRQFNTGEISPDQLTEEAIRRGFANVIDAFHVVYQGPIPTQFFIDGRRANTGIRITDEFSKLLTEAS